MLVGNPLIPLIAVQNCLPRNRRGSIPIATATGRGVGYVNPARAEKHFLNSYRDGTIFNNWIHKNRQNACRRPLYFLPTLKTINH
jgi:hypothetical protein